MAGLLYLQHAFDASGEAVVNTWVENPYWHFFAGKTYLQTELPIDPSSLMHLRKCIGEGGTQTLLAPSIEAARKAGMIRKTSVNRVIVDTTVMLKASAHPTDSRPLEGAREHMVKLANEEGIHLRQNYNRKAPRLTTRAGRYAHAKQYKRMRKTPRTLLGRVGSVRGEIGRKAQELPERMRDKARDLPARAGRILPEKTKDKNKLYALHAPEVERISKCKARTPYEFVVEVTVAITLKEGLVLGMRSMPGNPAMATPWPRRSSRPVSSQTPGRRSPSSTTATAASKSTARVSSALGRSAR